MILFNCKPIITEEYIFKIWYLFAIEIIDTQVARRGRQYHRNPPYKKRKKNEVNKRKNRKIQIKCTKTPPTKKWLAKEKKITSKKYHLRACHTTKKRKKK